MRELQVYNTLTRRKEIFTALHPGRVGMYVCGPTVYGAPHLGHARPAITFDVLFRLLRALGYQVRYVRNVTDVGHLEHDQDQGEDKIAKRARLEQLEPMEVAQAYTEAYHAAMRALNVLPPSIEPRASGHILEQIALVQRILDAGFAYQSQGSVYFDIEKYNASAHYGKLSGRDVDDMLANTRALDGQGEKRNPLDFALWKRAEPVHIMRWPSPWSEGFPGWHLECSAMGMKYLGEEFDIHGGGLDLMFPHHECEIAQNQASCGHPVVRYWMHNNLITIDGQKMGKSLGNFITLEELFNGTHPKLEQAYGPMTIRFFTLQAHYRSTLDFSNAALQAAEKGHVRLMKALRMLDGLKPSDASAEEVDVQGLETKCWAALLDDMNTPILLAVLFEGAKLISRLDQGEAKISAKDLESLRNLYHTMVYEILGLLPPPAQSEGDEHTLSAAMNLILELRAEAKEQKDYATADRIRSKLHEAGIEIQDTPQGSTWRKA